MRARHPQIPRHWLMTDERMGDGLWDALHRLPRGSGVVVRHYSLGRGARAALFRRILAIARRRQLIVLRAGPGPLRGEHGVHNGRGRGLQSRAVHDRAQAVAAKRAGADLIFVSPMFATRSHPGAGTLGPLRAALLSHDMPMAVIALGGMDARRGQRLSGLGFHGWAAIDAWTQPKGRIHP